MLRVLTFDEALTIMYPSSYHCLVMSNLVIITRFNHVLNLNHCPLLHLEFGNFIDLLLIDLNILSLISTQFHKQLASLHLI